MRQINKLLLGVALMFSMLAITSCSNNDVLDDNNEPSWESEKVELIDSYVLAWGKDQQLVRANEKRKFITTIDNTTLQFKGPKYQEDVEYFFLMNQLCMVHAIFQNAPFDKLKKYIENKYKFVKYDDENNYWIYEDDKLNMWIGISNQAEIISALIYIWKDYDSAIPGIPFPTK